MNGVMNAAAEYLALMLKTNRTLTHLFLYSNEISDERVPLLANVRTFHNNTLRALLQFVQRW